MRTQSFGGYQYEVRSMRFTLQPWDLRDNTKVL